MLEIANRVGVSGLMKRRWQQRYAEERLDGLLRDETPPPGVPPVPRAKVYAVVERTLRGAPGGDRALKRSRYVRGDGSVAAHHQCIWLAHRLQPPLIRTFETDRPRLLRQAR